MAEKKSRWFKLPSLGRSHSQGQAEAPTKSKNVFSIRSSRPRPEPARDKGKGIQVPRNGAADEPSMELKAEENDEQGTHAPVDDCALLPLISSTVTNEADRSTDSTTHNSSALLPPLPTISSGEVPVPSLLETAERDDPVLIAG
jgi:hypothetical protein